MSKTGLKTNRLAFIITECSITAFMIFRILEAAAEKNTRIMIVALAATGSLTLIIALLHRARRFLNEAFLMPMILYAAYTAASFAMRSFFYFFPTCLGICAVGALYFNHRALRTYILVSNIASITLLFFKIPTMHPSRTVHITESLMLWFISLFGSVFIYMTTVFASNKNNAAMKAQNSFTALLSSTPNQIVLVDSLNRVTYFSEPFARLIRLVNPAMAIGRPVFDLLKDMDLKAMIYRILKTGETCEVTQEIILEDQRYYFRVITASLDSETKGRLINLIDITPIMRARLEAEAASRSKSAFLATMSHEIRTPLNAIIGLSEIELQKKLPSETRQGIEKIHNSGASLLAIVNDILDISKIESGSFELVLGDYDLPSMINDAIQLNIVRIGSKPVVFYLKIDETIPAKLLGDELRVKQILNNLLSNAFKYTEEGSVRFTIVWERWGDNALLTFTIEDTGRGIREEDISILFSEYRQLDARANRNIEGTGLGLSITKNLVDLMKGTISVKSAYGKGSVFIARIPQRIVDETPIGEATARNLEQFRFRENRHSRGGLRLIRNYMPYGRVLVVDDVETNLDVAKGLLLPYGLSMDFALSGQEAIAKVRIAGNDSTFRYDLILMDHMMPGMDGIEATRIIRNEINNEYARTVPIIALTANALTGNEEMFLSRGFNGYISKPIDIMRLDVALNTWIRNKQSQETILRAEKEKTGDPGQDGLSVLPPDLYVEGLDLAQGKERYNGEAAYVEVLRSYHLHTPGLLKKLRELLSEGEESLAEYTVVIHGLKGSSYGICANDAGGLAEELETAARAKDIDRVRAGNNAFVETVEYLLRDLGELLKKAEDRKETKRKLPAPDPAALSRLREAAALYRVEAMEQNLNELESFEYESGGELIPWLREQMDNLEYDAIRKKLEEALNHA
ncbi:MAG: response regulator [Treponema sp.]|jgi:signal transduction histidine kinase/DNA-binding NarL/FixJ family response regulator|nr:response regulator [Treponema sp.]